MLATLNEGLAPSGDEDRVFALAELSFLNGEKTKSREQTLAAVVYAYAFLFPGIAGTPPGPLDPAPAGRAQPLQPRAHVGARVAGSARPSCSRAACTRCRSGVSTWRSTQKELALGAATSSTTSSRWRSSRCAGCATATAAAGLGAPLAAALETVPGITPPPGAELIPPRLRVPVTAVPADRRRARPSAQTARLRGDLELYSPGLARDARSRRPSAFRSSRRPRRRSPTCSKARRSGTSSSPASGPAISCPAASRANSSCCDRTGPGEFPSCWCTEPRRARRAGPRWSTSSRTIRRSIRATRSGCSSTTPATRSRTRAACWCRR